jgi:hypothetical protein
MADQQDEAADKEGGVCVRNVDKGKEVRPTPWRAQPPEKGKEARLSGKEVTLKGSKGYRVDARLARAMVDEFRCLLERHPVQFGVLHDLVEGRKPEVDSRAILKELSLLVTKTGKPRPYVREVFQASFCDGDPVTFADPFEPATEAEEHILESCETASVKRLSSFARRMGLDRSGTEGG